MTSCERENEACLFSTIHMRSLYRWKFCYFDQAICAWLDEMVTVKACSIVSKKRCMCAFVMLHMKGIN